MDSIGGVSDLYFSLRVFLAGLTKYVMGFTEGVSLLPYIFSVSVPLFNSGDW